MSIGAPGLQSGVGHPAGFPIRKGGLVHQGALSQVRQAQALPFSLDAEGTERR